MSVCWSAGVESAPHIQAYAKDLMLHITSASLHQEGVPSHMLPLHPQQREQSKRTDKFKDTTIPGPYPTQQSRESST